MSTLSTSDSTSLDWECMSLPTKTRNVADLTSSISTDLRFQGKVILITGAGGQLGRQGCIYMAQRGCAVVALDQHPVGLLETFASILQAQGGDSNLVFKPYKVDVTDSARVQSVVEHCVQRWGKIDLLWNNAGYQGQITPIVSQDPNDFANVMNVNVTGMFIVLQAVGRVMIALGKGGSIVNTASVAGLRGTPAMAGYASSKAAVLSLTVCAAKEWACHQIRVNACSPALIGPGTLWERQNTLHSQVGPPYFADTPEAVGEAKIASVPMKRLGSPDEVVQSVAFLLSDDASYTTGINLTVDGGMSAGLKA